MIELLCGHGYVPIWEAWGAVGDWIGGAGAFAAAGVALHIAYGDRRDRAAENAARQSMREYQCAMLLYPALIDIASQTSTLYERLSRVATGGAVHSSKTTDLSIVGLEDVEAQLDRIDALQTEAATAVMTVLSLGNRVNRVIDRSIKSIVPGRALMVTVTPGILAEDEEQTMAKLAEAAVTARDFMNDVVASRDFADLTAP